MLVQASDLPALAGTPSNAALAVRRLAARAWVAMEGAGVLPTPRHFELWYIHLGGTNPELSARLTALLGKAAIANAKVAYADVYEQVFAGPRWEALAAKCARKQRPLWASTSTKNPAYRDVLYVEELIGADTVDTMPPATIKDFLDHGRVRDSLTEDVAGARKALADLEATGISMAQVTAKLQDDGVASFSKSFHDLIDTISAKRQEMLAHAG